MEQLVYRYDVRNHVIPNDLYPRKLRNARVLRVVFEQHNQRKCTATMPQSHNQQIHTYALHPSGLEILVVDQPTPQVVPKPTVPLSKLNAFYESMGRLRYHWAPVGLIHLQDKVAHYLSRPEFLHRSDGRHYHHLAYQPDGVWEYIPGDHPRDFRMRARWLVPLRGEAVSLTKLGIRCSGDGIGLMQQARVTIDYTMP